MDKELALIILNWNGTADTIECIKSLESQKSIYDIYVLDNGSKAEQVCAFESYLKGSAWKYDVIQAEHFEECPVTDAELRYICSAENLGFAVGNNFIGLEISKQYPYIMLLNNDTVVEENCISQMLQVIKTSYDIALTCDIRYYAERELLWNAGGKFKWYGDRKYFTQKKVDRMIRDGRSYLQADYITGCALLIDSSYIREYGLLTDKFFHGEEDYNFCFLAKKRHKSVGVDLTSRLYHKVGRSIYRESNSLKERRSMVVHYTNRIIDYKGFYGHLHWLIWRKCYLFLIGLKRRLAGMKRKNVKILKKRVKFYTDTCQDVKREVFLQIMNDEEII